ncbi:PadR family transcriptional regulator [Mesoplasma entomophilum]|uniref:PadR family transcriptional regulator n=1 Tax=Mesoplasma entomophilum TaxID=2149 RepID=A0A3S5XZQ1_9MOLU|nr:PadR family transcriptional regulator [Mesoplasma entomophilum]ATQ35482.1 PadR family transcriptional regulator [Mesoplasma entomophilum]ATZ19442.1 PadR family transcriptional regulator [Mesoplasma entomophilum]
MDKELKKGILEMLVLNFLSQKTFYAYELNKKLNEVVETNESTTYAIFKKLVDKGFCEHFFEESSSGPMRKCYKITSLGREQLINQKNAWKDISDKVNSLILE